MKFLATLLALAVLSSASGERSLLQVTPQTNYNPVTILVNSAPFDVLATPITPSAPYSQRLFQCNLTGDSRYPPYASGTFPLTVRVPNGQKVRVIFANGNLNGATVTQQGEPGVIVQQGGAVIVQQSGSASPIVQNVGSPVVQAKAPPAALVVQQGPTTVVQQPGYGQSPVVQQAPMPPSAPGRPATPGMVPPGVPGAPGTPGAPATPSSPTPPSTPTNPPSTPTNPPSTPTNPPSTPTNPPKDPCPAGDPGNTPGIGFGICIGVGVGSGGVGVGTGAGVGVGGVGVGTGTGVGVGTGGIGLGSGTGINIPTGRRLLQDRVPGGPNNGLVEYVALAASNNVPGFVVPNTQFGVPYVEFTASSAAVGQVAQFRGALEVAQVVGGVPLYPFRPNQSLSPECQVNVNFVVA